MPMGSFTQATHNCGRDEGDARITEAGASLQGERCGAARLPAPNAF
jgi:hypothetical protein